MISFVRSLTVITDTQVVPLESKKEKLHLAVYHTHSCTPTDSALVRAYEHIVTQIKNIIHKIYYILSKYYCNGLITNNT